MCVSESSQLDRFIDQATVKTSWKILRDHFGALELLNWQASHQVSHIPTAALLLLGLTSAAPFISLLLSDHGARVLRVTRPESVKLDPAEIFTRLHTAIALNLKDPSGLGLLEAILRRSDILIDPFRPNVLENLGLNPAILLEANPRLIVARLAGFRKDGPYSNMAGHDINYLAVSGVLSQLGRAGDTPYAPANILADFAGGGLMCGFGILAALINRSVTGRGQIVETNMVDGTAYLGTFMRRLQGTPLWNMPRGENLLDGGAPWYDVYECRDGRHMAVGALEPQFFSRLLQGLHLDDSWLKQREDRTSWPRLRKVIRERFLTKTRREWEDVFDGTDACCTPVLTQGELVDSGYEQRLPVTLTRPDIRPYEFPKLSESDDTSAKILYDWMGWRKGHEYEMGPTGLVKLPSAKL